MNGVEVKLLMTFMTEYGRKVSLFITCLLYTSDAADDSKRV